MSNDECIISAWRNLVEALDRSKLLYAAATDGGRQAAVEALKSFCEFVISIDASKDPLLTPIRNLSCELVGLSRGSGPMVRPNTRSGGQPDTFGWWFIKMHAAAMMTMLMDDLRYSRPQAAREVAAVLRKCGPHLSQVRWEDVAGWRDYVKRRCWAQDFDNFLLMLRRELLHAVDPFMPASARMQVEALTHRRIRKALTLFLLTAVETSGEVPPAQLRSHTVRRMLGNHVNGAPLGAGRISD